MPIFNFDTTYLNLPDSLFEKTNPIPVSSPKLVLWNERLAQYLALPAFKTDDLNLVLAGNKIIPGTTPIAQAYAGHQFGHFTMLGDGRAHLLGEHVTSSGERFDIQLKGSGPTAFSRRGDGRAALGPMIREYIISEAMFGLRIPTTQSLAVVTTAEEVQREKVLPGAILTRVAASHIRIGTFEYAARLNDLDTLRRLTDYTILRHYPDCENHYQRFLEKVIDRQLNLIAQWMSFGFIHGVMNTDNTAISGETIDYGPCAFLDFYEPNKVFSSIDRHGRYSFSKQPQIIQWNLARFAETILPLLNPDPSQSLATATQAIESIPEKFTFYWLKAFRAKFGLTTAHDSDAHLINEFLEILKTNQADYTNSFRALGTDKINFADNPEYKRWLTIWRDRLALEERNVDQARQLIVQANPALIPRNALVEKAILLAQQGDFNFTLRLIDALRTPFTERSEFSEFYQVPSTDENYQTFCGT